MKRIVISAAGLFAVAGGAFAADLPAAAPVYTKAPPRAVYSWTGFYVGGNAGGAWGTFDATTTTSIAPVGTFSYFVTTDPGQIAAAGAQNIRSTGFTGGFEAGYNFQASNWVFGLEGDIESFHLSGGTTSGPIVYLSVPSTTFTVNSNASTSWLATARGRVGFAADNWLFFATGGAAFTDLHGNFAFTDTFSAASESSSFSNTETGYTVGGGIEVGFWGHWSLKAEYLYVDFGQISAVSTNLITGQNAGFAFHGGAYPENPFTHSFDLKANIARLGLNYRF
jgi:outer membrane immunogenic protein